MRKEQLQRDTQKTKHGRNSDKDTENVTCNGYALSGSCYISRHFSPVAAGEKGGQMTREEIQKTAESYFVRIGDGHKNGIHRPDIKQPEMDRVDRALRRMINHENKNGDCIICGDTGYYRPIPSDPVDALEYKAYRKMDDSRAHDLIVKGHLMDMAFENRRKEGEYAVQIRNQREASGTERIPESRAELLPRA